MRYLQEGLSLAEIGARTDRHPSTVAYWLKAHHLVAVHHDRCAPKGGISEDALAPLVACGLSIRDIAATLDVGYSTVRYWLSRYGLRTERSRRAALAPEKRPPTAVRVCRQHGRTTFVRENTLHYRCAKCRRDAVARRRRHMKLLLIEEAGGRCRLCGFDAWPAALQFHHLDPATKRFAISNRGSALSLERMRAEARKCALLCANCHAGVESGVIALPTALLDCAR